MYFEIKEPLNYVLAKDDDFLGSRIITESAEYSSWKHIENDEYVEIPHTIKGEPVTSYEGMFANTEVRGVKSNNKNVTNMSSMFVESQATSLDLSELDTSNVTDMSDMFQNRQATVSVKYSPPTNKVLYMR